MAQCIQTLPSLWPLISPKEPVVLDILVLLSCYSIEQRNPGCPSTLHNAGWCSNLHWDSPCFNIAWVQYYSTFKVKILNYRANYSYTCDICTTTCISTLCLFDYTAKPLAKITCQAIAC